MTKLFLSLTIFILLAVPENSRAATVLDKATDYYRAGNYDSTITVIRNHLKKYGKSNESEELVPLISEALVRKGDYESVHRLFSLFRQKFPQSRFIPRLWYLEGVALARQERYSGSIAAFSASIAGGVSPVLDSLTLANTEIICRQLTSGEISEIAQMSLNPRLMEIIRYYEISGYYSMGQFAKVQNQTEEFRKSFPRSRFEPALRDLALKARERQRQTLQIGILAPVSGDEAEVGKRVVQGAQLAIELLNRQNGMSVKDIVLDTKGNMVETARRTREFLEDHRVPVIVGPVLSHTATVCAAMSVGKPVVMISPSATDDGIAGLGRNIFQMNVTMGVLGRKVARYAMDNLNIREFAIMAPQTSYGRLMVESFKDELRKKNMEVVAEEYFEEGANDFGPQFMRLRSKLLYRHLEKVALDRGQDFKGKISRSDSLKYIDSTLSVGGLFIPADVEDVVMLAPQAIFHRIRTQMLGSNGWHNQKTIQDGRQYVRNTIISTSFDINQSSSEWQEFRNAYKARFNSEPDRVAALGYDAASLAMKALKEVGDDPQKLTEILLRKQEYNGLSGKVSFDENSGTNNEAVIMKISENGFVRVQ
ncbi:MAG: ABC transporter substrate-binding protein [Fibrobacter sp.]|jgi:ABC-type branched-subunit amino acid transport system substrate-binding protein|nr:ABC transporter substrate-binding protein [Fibrobacter sp.]